MGPSPLRLPLRSLSAALLAGACALACGAAAAEGKAAARGAAGPAAPAAGASADAHPATTAKAAKIARAHRPARGHRIDRSGRPRTGKASYYARSFAGRTMADGTPMDPHGDNAASKTLPLGTKARVTNLETGRSATVTIKDRGPYVPGRIVDLSPRTARDVGITPHKGVAPVEVAPIALPPPGVGETPAAPRDETRSPANADARALSAAR